MVSWTGMRGVVTLAAAAAIPATTVTGEPFPERATIQAIAFVGQRRHAADPGVDAAAADPAAASVALHPTTTPPTARRSCKAERVVHDAADEVLAEFRANPPDGLDPRVLAEIRAIDRPALAGRRRDARPRGAHEARRGVLGAVPRRARRAAGRADRRTRRRAASRTKPCGPCSNGSTCRRPACRRAWRAGSDSERVTAAESRSRRSRRRRSRRRRSRRRRQSQPPPSPAAAVASRRRRHRRRRRRRHRILPAAKPSE